MEHSSQAELDAQKEEKKQVAIATKKAEINNDIVDKYGSFIPQAQMVDPRKWYSLICQNIFGNTENIEPTDLLFALHQAKMIGVNPLKAKSIYVIKFKGRNTLVLGIDSFRDIAEQSGMYGGSKAPEYEMDGDKIISCTVTVLKAMSNGAIVESAATAFFDEFNKGKNNWSSMPKHMIAKVAEAHALRKTFPAIGTTYVDDEIQQNPREVKQVKEEPTFIDKQRAKLSDKLEAEAKD